MKRFCILLTTIILLLAGCGTTGSFVSRVLPGNDWPKKRVMIMPAADLTEISLNELTDGVSEELSENLRKTGFFNVYHHNNTKKFPFFKPGDPVDPVLMREAKEIGMNAIIFETVNPIETNPVKSGIWPFRKEAWRFTVSINIDIVDVTWGIMLLSKEVASNITLLDEEAKEETEKAANIDLKKRALKKCLPDMLKKAAKASIISLKQKAWTGTILSVDNKRIIINAGRDVGLRPGIVFEVFGEGESITSFKGQTYQLPGPKVGEIIIVDTEPRHSSAEPIKEGDFKSGQIIRVKD